MPPKTVAEVAEMVAKLQREHEVFVTRTKSRLSELERLELYRLRERLAVIETLLAELTKRVEEADRRRWQLWLGIGICTLTFAANLTVQLIVLFARR